MLSLPGWGGSLMGGVGYGGSCRGRGLTDTELGSCHFSGGGGGSTLKL